MASKTLGRVQSVSKGRSKSKSKASEYLYIAEEIPPEEKIQALNAKLQAIQQELGNSNLRSLKTFSFSTGTKSACSTSKK